MRTIKIALHKYCALVAQGYVAKYTPIVKRMSEMGVATWEKHIKFVRKRFFRVAFAMVEWLRHLRRHLYELIKRQAFYQPRVPPAEREELTGSSAIDRVMLGVERDKYTLGFKRELSEYLKDVDKLHVDGAGTKTDTVRYVTAERTNTLSQIALAMSQVFVVEAY